MYANAAKRRARQEHPNTKNHKEQNDEEGNDLLPQRSTALFLNRHDYILISDYCTHRHMTPFVV